MSSSIAPAVSEQLFDGMQAGFIHAIMSSLDGFKAGALYLLIAVATLELVFFGLIWAFRNDEGISSLVLKVFKIGFFFFLVSNWEWVSTQLLMFFRDLGLLLSPDGIKEGFTSPGSFWVLGFKTGASMLKVAVEYGSYNFGLTLLYFVLGIGTLLFFAAGAGQILLSILFFDLLSLAALILIPLSVFKPLMNFFQRVIQQMFVAGIRLMVVILVWAIAVLVVSQLSVGVVSDSTNLAKPLGLFFAMFVLVILIYMLPSLVGKSVGIPAANLFSSSGLNAGEPSNVAVSPGYSTQMVAPGMPAMANVSGYQSSSGQQSTPMSNMQAATMVSDSGQSSPTQTNVQVQSTTQAANISSDQKNQNNTGQAVDVNRSISDDTVKKVTKNE